MGATPTMPDVPGAPDADREEGKFSSGSPGEGSAVAGLRGAVPEKTGAEEDWTSLATGDPAFWIKGHG
jgi:hypothetical protein